MEDILYSIDNTTNSKLLKVLKEWDEILNVENVPIQNDEVAQILKEGWEAEILKKYKN